LFELDRPSTTGPVSGFPEGVGPPSAGVVFAGDRDVGASGRKVHGDRASSCRLPARPEKRREEAGLSFTSSAKSTRRSSGERRVDHGSVTDAVRSIAVTADLEARELIGPPHP